MKYNDLINELLDLLDNNLDIIKIKELNKILLNDKELQSDINKYHLTNDILIKKKLFLNDNYLEYLKSINNLNLLIQEINNEFNLFKSRECYDESN